MSVHVLEQETRIHPRISPIGTYEVKCSVPGCAASIIAEKTTARNLLHLLHDRGWKSTRVRTKKVHLCAKHKRVKL